MKHLFMVWTLGSICLALSQNGTANSSGMNTRIVCQEYPIKEKKSILVFDYTTVGLQENTDTNIPGVPGTVKIYNDFSGKKNLFQKNMDVAQNYALNEDITKLVTTPSTVVNGKVFLIANRYYILKGKVETTGLDGKKVSEDWEISFDLIVNNVVNSTLFVSANGKKSTRSFRCRQDEPLLAEQAGSVTPEEAKCLTETGAASCPTESSNP